MWRRLAATQLQAVAACQQAGEVRSSDLQLVSRSEHVVAIIRTPLPERASQQTIAINGLISIFVLQTAAQKR